MSGNKPSPNPRPNDDSDILGLFSVSGCHNPNRLGDVVFVHGLAGHPWNTWHWQNPNDKHYQKDNWWLNWLGNDLKDSGVDVGIWTFGYNAARLRPNGSAMPLFDQASNLLNYLENFDIGRRPIIFVTHSLGGLLVKKMLSSAGNFSRDKRKKAVIDSTKGIVFLSTPHLGSGLAQWVKFLTGFLSTVSVEELKAHASQLRELDEWYRQHVGEFDIATKIYCETRPTNGVLVVNASSANPGITDVKPIAIDADHNSIAKPKQKDNTVYLGVERFIEDYLLPQKIDTNPIIQYKDNKNLEIIGFDLGHGESAIAITNLSSSSEPQVPEIGGKKSIITAVTFSKTGGIIVGEDAYIQNNGIDNLYIHFKTPNFNRSETTSLKFFVQECLHLLKKEGKVKLDTDTHFFVGHPSGWNEESLIKEYEKILEDAGMTNVKVRPESRAAFLEAKETGRLQKSFTQLLDNLLIIDIGSSTTDFTIIKNSEENPLDLGYNNLGGSLIDELILKKHLELESPENREELDRLFSYNRSLKLQCLLICRTAKEEYFSKENQNGVQIQKYQKINKANGENLYFEVSINKEKMEDILSYPLSSSIAPLKEKTWKQAFREALQECKKEIQSPELIFMTGGGSHMSFTHEICQEEFPQSKVIRGLEPELSVAKGLAILGRIDFKIDLFREEVKEFIEQPEKLDYIIKETLQKFSNELTDSLTKKTLEILKSTIFKWRNGTIKTILELEKITELEIKNVLDKDNKFSKIETQKLIEHLAKEIQKPTDELCSKYNIKKGIFDISISSENKDVKFNLKLSSFLIQKIAEKVYVIIPVLITALFLIIFLIVILTSLEGGMKRILLQTLAGIGFLVKREAALSDIEDRYDKIKSDFETFLNSFLKTSGIHITLRKALFNDDKINNLISKIRDDVKQDIYEQLNSQLLPNNRYSEIKNYVSERLNEQADIASNLIKRAEVR